MLIYVLLTAIYLSLLASAKHYDCHWKPVANNQQPEDLGYLKYLEATPTDVNRPEGPKKIYYWEISGIAWGIVAGWGAKPNELEFGPPPCHKGHVSYGNNGHPCRGTNWLVCDGVPNKQTGATANCYGVNKYDDCAFRESYVVAPPIVSVWYIPEQ